MTVALVVLLLAATLVCLFGWLMGGDELGDGEPCTPPPTETGMHCE